MPTEDEASNAIGDLIRDLMNWRGETQSGFAEALGVDKSTVLRWLSGDAVPSAEAWLKMAALAHDLGAAEAAFFFRQSRIDPQVLISAADSYMHTGGVDMRQILASAETILRERLADSKVLEEQGKVVLVPPFGEGASVAQEPLGLVPVPAFLVPNKTSTFYIVAQPPSIFDGSRRGFAPGDIIVFDLSEELTTDFERMVGEEWLVRVPPKAQDPGGLSIVRPGYISEGGTRHAVLVESDIPPRSWAGLYVHHPQPFIKLGSSHGSTPSFRERSRAAGRALSPDWYEVEEIKFLGKFIGRFRGEPGDLWNRGAKA